MMTRGCAIMEKVRLQSISDEEIKAKSSFEPLIRSECKGYLQMTSAYQLDDAIFKLKTFVDENFSNNPSTNEGHQSTEGEGKNIENGQLKDESQSHQFALGEQNILNDQPMDEDHKDQFTEGEGQNIEHSLSTDECQSDQSAVGEQNILNGQPMDKGQSDKFTVGEGQNMENGQSTDETESLQLAAGGHILYYQPMDEGHSDQYTEGEEREVENRQPMVESQSCQSAIGVQKILNVQPMDEGHGYQYAEGEEREIEKRQLTHNIQNHQSAVGELNLKDYWIDEDDKSTSAEMEVFSDFSDVDPDYIPPNSPEEYDFDVVSSSSPELELLNNDEQSTSKVIKTFRPSLTVCQKADTPIQVNQKIERKKKWNKVQYCLYCDKGVQKLPRHLFTMHGDEESVKNILKMEKKSEERARNLDAIRNEGNFLHNRKVLTSGEGQIVTKRVIAVNKTKTIDDFLPCPKCHAMIMERYLVKHKCSKSVYHSERRQLKAQALFLLPSIELPHQFKEDVLKRMKVDEVYRILRNDWLILEMGRKYYEKIGTGRNCSYNVSQKMRELGKLLKELREVYASDKKDDGRAMTFENFLKMPGQVTNIIKAVRITAGFDEKTHKFEKPSTALRLGNYIRRCVSIGLGKAAEKQDRLSSDAFRDFLLAFDNRWNSEVSAAASRTLDQRKWNKSDDLPLAKDIQCLITYLKSQIKKIVKIVEKLPDKDSLCQLSKCTLCLIISFNRKRSGEAQRILVADVIAGMDNYSANSDILESLDDFEKNLASVLKRIVTRGKRGRGVPILVTPLMQKALRQLCSPRNRAVMEINNENEYVFATPGTKDGCYRGNGVIRHYSELCGAKKPELLRAPKMRKQLATMTALLNLKKNELDVLASFMGHDLFIHRKEYRLPQGALELAKVSKILTMKDGVGAEEGVTSDDSSDESDTNDKIIAKENTQTSHKITSRKIKVKKYERKPWTEEEIQTLNLEFKNDLLVKSYPSKAQLDKLRQKYPEMYKGRNNQQIKARLQYIMNKKN